MLYLPIRNEVTTYCFMNHFWEKEKKTFLPNIRDNTLFPSLYFHDSQFVAGAFNTLQPRDTDDIEKEDYPPLDIIILPCVGTDLNKNRLGYGKGYYDQFLVHYPQALKIGICYDFQIIENLPTIATDIKLDVIVSNQRIIS